MNTARMSKLIVLSVIIALASGCTKFDLRKNIPWGEGFGGTLDQPMRVVPVWTDAVLTQGQEKPTRGFGGRIMFYGRNDEKPSKVEGTIVVYAFDETNRDKRNVVPDHKYVFLPELVEKQYSKNRIGHSYSVWVPWDEVGGPQKEISLLVRFIPKKGGVIISEQTKLILPGVPPEFTAPNHQPNIPAAPGSAGGWASVGAQPNQTPPQGNPANQYGVQQASFQQPIGTAAGGMVNQASLNEPQSAPQRPRLRSSTVAVRPAAPFQTRGAPGYRALMNANGDTMQFQTVTEPNGLVAPGLMPPDASAVPLQQPSAPAQMPVFVPQPVLMMPPATMPPASMSQAAVPNTTSALPATSAALAQPQPPAPAQVTAAAQQPQRAREVSVHYGPPPPRALGAPIAQLTPLRDRWQQSRGGSPSTLASPPSLGTGLGHRGYLPAAAPMSN